MANWKGRRQSTNIEDRRDPNYGGKATRTSAFDGSRDSDAMKSMSRSKSDYAAFSRLVDSLEGIPRPRPNPLRTSPLDTRLSRRGVTSMAKNPRRPYTATTGRRF